MFANQVPTPKEIRKLAEEVRRAIKKMEHTAREYERIARELEVKTFNSGARKGAVR